MGFPDGLKKLPDARGLARNPTGGAWGHVTFHTLDLGVRGIKVGGEFGIHDMARLAAKLGCLHVFHSPIGKLRSNDHV
jgi:hypothetical protein